MLVDKALVGKADLFHGSGSGWACAMLPDQGLVQGGAKCVIQPCK